MGRGYTDGHFGTLDANGAAHLAEVISRNYGTHPRLDARTRIALAFMSWMHVADSRSTTPYCCAGVEKLAESSSTSPTTVRRWLADMERYGVIVKKETDVGKLDIRTWWWMATSDDMHGNKEGYRYDPLSEVVRYAPLSSDGLGALKHINDTQPISIDPINDTPNNQEVKEAATLAPSGAACGDEGNPFSLQLEVI
ncbi:MAG: helix-turn-helix domain-containing protein [Atopobiaceae bacterium]|jgi:hypothetical protein|nr:helix-turn-helix domain-containing protein [Atopobiaceae bacterium]MCI2173690.1 helix-turn-helix domain-containing protein [Atopobiaceae bacterium]MCI2207668.1 helix-turn-helix domain-containing protein [Atopobiaceae bacterium]